MPFTGARTSWILANLIGVLAAAPHVEAQSIAAGLGHLLTDQTPPPPGYVRDMVAAETTFHTVASLFLVELSSLPVASSSGGFVYRFNPNFGTVERSSDSFGPFFAERALRNGEERMSIGFAYQHARFTTLQGANIEAGSFPTNTARFVNQLQPFSVDTLSLTLEADTVTAFFSYGVNDRLDLGVAAPVTTLRFSGRRSNTFQGQTTLQSVQSDSATGFGDVALNARYRLTGVTANGFAIGTDLRLPTGREQDLLGAGEPAWRLLGIASWESGPLAVHANGGFGLGGASREQFVSTAATAAAGLKVSVVGELIVRRLSQLSTVADVYQPHPVLAGVETMRWLPAEVGVTSAFLVTGAKWNVQGNWLLNAHVLTRLNDTGLRARFTPSIGLDYAFGF